MKNIIYIYFVILVLSITASCEKEHDPDPILQTEKPSFIIADIVINEADSSLLRIDVQLIGKHAEPIFISYRTIQGTALNGEDYIDIEGGFQFSGEDSLQQATFFVEILDDDIFEEEEYFEIVFEMDTTFLWTDNSLQVIIQDDDDEFTDNNYPGYVTKKHQEGWNLIWSDEFGGDKLNTDDWTTVIGNGCPELCGFGNNEKQYYRNENIKIDSGLLTITALKQNYQNNNYTSARLTSKNKFFFKYGKLDIRARLPYGKGIWPALWLQGEDANNLGWPERGETDLMELRGSKPNIVNSTIHYKNALGNHANTSVKSHELVNADYSDEFHVFSMVWNEHKIEFYVDDIRYNTVFFSLIYFYNGENPFLEPFYILMNVAVGGNYDGNPDGTTVWPQTMDVDYLRVYQQ